MNLIEEALSDARDRRKIARTRPASHKQIDALLKFGCNPLDLDALTSGEASDLVRCFISQIRTSASAQKRA